MRQARGGGGTDDMPAMNATIAMNTKRAYPGDSQGWMWFAPVGVHLARCAGNNRLPEIKNATARLAAF